ncbi:hypothetical protein [Anaeromyxobacter oryzae]|uniref:Uncharacterized protein n=1 Tax=Anaeromyxobacter oryzae TaxID=2918170 RepID=A0ABM7WQB9_9BACT|nr:hypothetical protein [Anaeromyxobacter oryzae]BDG01655.1 hypothetical protein AMOR_06510 [Anaeromyxobacter oryzae]
MPHSGPQVARGHLRLAPAPAGRPRPEKRFVLAFRALAVALRVAWVTATAWIAAALALTPLLWRRAPLGRRLRPQARREARVIPFQPRRQQAMPR